MTVKIVKIMEEDWDYLIVLDACRYDYFEKEVDEFFVGKLEKRVSLGSWSSEWLQNNFPGYYTDVVYISANVIVNSITEAVGFDARQHFDKIVDVCLFGWDETLGTVPPRRVVDAAFDAFAKFPGRRYIVHFVQPHEPYLAGGFFIKGYPLPFRNGEALIKRRKYVIEGFLDLVYGLLVRIGIGTFAHAVRQRTGLPPTDWLLRQMLGLPPIFPMDAVRRKYGKRGLREAYAANLRMVLGHAAVLSNWILTQRQQTDKPKIILTADHGEILGEGGRYGHHSNWGRNPILLHVPWFTLESVVESEGIDLSRYSRERGRIKDRVGKLRKRGSLSSTGSP